MLVRLAKVRLSMIVSLTGLSLLLSGCGFQLAGQQPLPQWMESVALQADDTRSDVYLALERELIDRGVVISASSSQSLSLSAVDTGQRVLSVSARNIPREFEVFYTTAFSLSRDQEVVLEQPPLTLTRDYQWSELEVLGKVREEQLLRELIVDDLVDSILRQIATLD
ncbi:MAG: LPS assembly lipoprotein LptE [Pseudomonadota bacterium]